MPPLIPQDPSQIQRHRPNTDDFVKNSREEDLWDLADISDAADASEQAAPLPMQPRRSMPSIPPLPSDKGESPPVDADKSGMPVLPVAITPRFQSRQSVNVARLGRVSPVRLSADSSAPESGAAVGDATPENLFEDAFDNLDDWDDALQIPVPISADNRLAAPEAEPTPTHRSGPICPVHRSGPIYPTHCRGPICPVQRSGPICPTHCRGPICPVRRSGPICPTHCRGPICPVHRSGPICPTHCRERTQPDRGGAWDSHQGNC